MMGAWRVTRAKAAQVRLLDLVVATLVTGVAGLLLLPIGYVLIESGGSEEIETIGLVLASSVAFLPYTLGVGLIAAFFCRRVGLIGPASAATAGAAVGGLTGAFALLLVGFDAEPVALLGLPLTGAAIGAALGAVFQRMVRAMRPAAFADDPQ